MKVLLRSKKIFLASVLCLSSIFVLSCVLNVDEIVTDEEEKIVQPQDSAELPEMYKTFLLSEEELTSSGIPTVYIQTKNYQHILSKETWLSATMEIANSPDESWNFEPIDISIRGRGNSTWGQAKKPFAIKLSKKQSICGMPKHKRWVLIANYLDNSFLKNSSAFILSEMLEMDYTVRGEFVNLVLNGNYVGLYWLGEAIKVDSKRVNINEDEDFLIEMDVYFDETWKFKSSVKNLPYNIKNDDLMTDERLENLKEKINELENILYSENFPYADENKNAYESAFVNHIDVESFAKFYLVNEIMHNGELGHPKSCYFTFNNSNSFLKAGPVWDFDWAGNAAPQTLCYKNTIYYDALFKTESFNEQLSSLVAGISTDDYLEKMEALREKISKSAELDGKRWGTDFRNPVGAKQANFDAYVDDLENIVVTKINYLKTLTFNLSE